LPERFLIHLGTIEPRKNLERLVEALPIVRRRQPHLCLVLVGAKGWLYAPLLERLERDGLTDSVRLLGWVEDDDLPAVIGAASLAVQPSLYEGFGLPLLEHMASGQVVAASDSGSHPEVGGEAAAYFDPANSAEMATVITRLLDDEEERRWRRQLGQQWAATFTWQRAARATIAVYDSLPSRRQKSGTNGRG
jgi:glycosyltransferase involved in cell wall biosynthesis